MKFIFSILAVFSISTACMAQLFVDTLPHNKNVLIEEFTGVRCNSCPQGHIEVANLVAAYPNRLFAAGMHSAAVGHTTPYPGEENLARPFPDQLAPQIPDLMGIPSGIISRRKFKNKEDHIFWPYASYHAPIDSAVNIVLAEASPFNIGVIADYDTVNKVLHVTSQVYTTLNSTGNYRLNVYFTQSNILVSQLNGNTVIPNYNQKHVFREILTPTWGATMAPSGVIPGDVFNQSHTFSNGVKNYKMQDVEVIVFITDHANIPSLKGNVVTAWGVHVNMTGAIATSVNEPTDLNDLNLYPNPGNSYFFTEFTGASALLEIYNSVGEKVYAARQEPFRSVDVSSLPSGLYVIYLRTEKGTSVRKFIKDRGE